MKMHHRKLLPCCIALALVSGQAAAVGLGELSLRSYLGAPLQAEVAINDTGELSADQLKVAIGSQSDYQVLGVEYNYLHSQLKIEPFIRNGHGYVRISTREPISEPYLNFVLNLHWPQGQVVREFTVLLDPAPTAVAMRPSHDVLPAPVADAVASTSGVTPAAAAPRRKARSERAAPVEGAYVVQRGDSLWRIAERMRPADTALEPVMNAILARNPQAFVGGDPARIKEAATIVAPSSEEIAAAGGSAPSSRRVAVNNTAPAQAATDLSEENAALKAQVAGLNDNVASLNQNLEQSQQRLHQMESQLDNIVQQMQQQRTAMAALSNSAASAPVAAAPVSGGSMINQVNAGELRPTPAARMPWWEHLLYWLGIGAVATWAIREHFWPQRRFDLLGAGASTINLDDEPPVSRPVVERRSWEAPAVSTPAQETAVPTLTQPAAEMDEIELTPAPQRQEDPVDASISAGVFVAFGRHDEAERLLRDAIQQAPDRVDLKLQLLDVYVQADRPEAFDALASEIERSHPTPDVAAELIVLRDSYPH